uniref:Uncharacterized protein n=1 Tax=Anguilla anguilla TaxID=7936 RepID=A0A0E9R6R5_ANGAN
MTVKTTLVDCVELEGIESRFWCLWEQWCTGAQTKNYHCVSLVFLKRVITLENYKMLNKV